MNSIVSTIDEFFWILRSRGVVLSIAQVIDAFRVVQLVGLSDSTDLRCALRCVLVDDASKQSIFDEAFDLFFESTSLQHVDLWQRLIQEGITEDELEWLKRQWMELGSVADGTFFENGLASDSTLTWLLHSAKVQKVVSNELDNPSKIGFVEHNMMRLIGMDHGAGLLQRLALSLAEAFGTERADFILTKIRHQLDRVRHVARKHLEIHLSAFEITDSKTWDMQPWTEMDEMSMQRMHQAIHNLGCRLTGAERLRLRRAQQGRVDLRKTMRRACVTLGVPIQIVYRKKKRNLPKLMVLCDVSESVRAVASLMLQFSFCAQRAFQRTRTFVFVSNFAETTELFRNTTVQRAMAQIASGSVIGMGGNSNYGRALRQFWVNEGKSMDRNTTVVILGDGRSNYAEDEAQLLSDIRMRCRELIWICPEGKRSWATGDSRMPQYAKCVSQVLIARNLREFEGAAREVANRRKTK